VVAKVELDTPEPAYAVQTKDKLIFPVGRFVTTLCSPELAYALASGHVRRVLESADYYRAPIFKGFVQYLYDMRLKAKAEGNAPLAFQLKILLNSLYGKFGQRGKVWERVGDVADMTAKVWTEYDAESGKSWSWRQFGGMVQAQVDEAEGRESHPAIAGHVTAYGRFELWAAAKQAGLDNVFYMDTDSLMVNQAGKDAVSHLLSETGLGCLKVERSASDAELWGLKDYRFGDYQRHKGVRKKAKWLDGSTVEQEQWSGILGLFASGKLDMPTTKTITKHLKRAYSKGTVLPTGEVLPVVLDAAPGAS